MPRETYHCRACGWDYSPGSWADAKQMLAALRRLGARIARPDRALCPDCFVGWLADRLDGVEARQP